MIESLTFLCLVSAIPDADSLTCADGTRIRIAAISALERNGECNSVPSCPTMRHAQAQPIVARMTLGKRLSCVQVGKSYNRIVARCSFADGHDLGCAIIASGAAVDWPKYRRQYGLPGCDVIG